MPFLSFLRPHARWQAQLHAFADGELADDERTRFGAHLVACAECVFALEETRNLQRALDAMPERAAPRSFRLTPAMVAATPARRPFAQPVAARPPWVALRLAQGFAVLAVVGLGTVAAIDFANKGKGDSSAASEGTVALQAESLAAPAAKQAADTAAGAGPTAGGTPQAAAARTVPAAPGAAVSGAGGVATAAASASASSPNRAPESASPTAAAPSQGDAVANQGNQAPNPTERLLESSPSDGDEGNSLLRALEFFFGAAIAASLAGWLFLHIRRSSL